MIGARPAIVGGGGSSSAATWAHAGSTTTLSTITDTVAMGPALSFSGTRSEAVIAAGGFEIPVANQLTMWMPSDGVFFKQGSTGGAGDRARMFANGSLVLAGVVNSGPNVLRVNRIAGNKLAHFEDSVSADGQDLRLVTAYAGGGYGQLHIEGTSEGAMTMAKTAATATRIKFSTNSDGRFSVFREAGASTGEVLTADPVRLALPSTSYLDLSAIGAAAKAIKFTLTSDTPVGATAGYMKVDAGGTAYYIAVIPIA